MAYTRGNLAVQERRKRSPLISRRQKSSNVVPSFRKRKAVVFAVRGICGCRHGCHWHESCSFL